MNCCDMAEQPNKKEVLYTKFVPKRKDDEKGFLQRYKGGCFTCGNEEEHS